MKRPAKESEKWVEYVLSALGAIGAIFGIVTYFGASATTAFIFLTGVGWGLAVPLLIMVTRSRRELLRIESELADTREQTHEWRTIAKNDSDSLNKFINRTMPLPRIIPRQAHAQNDKVSSGLE